LTHSGYALVRSIRKASGTNSGSPLEEREEHPQQNSIARRLTMRTESVFKSFDRILFFLSAFGVSRRINCGPNSLTPFLIDFFDGGFDRPVDEVLCEKQQPNNFYRRHLIEILSPEIWRRTKKIPPTIALKASGFAEMKSETGGKNAAAATNRATQLVFDCQGFFDSIFPPR
jgi:hypothetical protein